MKKRLSLGFGICCIVLGIGFLVYAAAHHYFLQKSLLLSRAQVKILAQAHLQPSTINSQTQHASQSAVLLEPIPTHIVIDGYIDVDVETLSLVNKQMVVSDTQATYLEESARPGQKGNIIIYGHNKKSIFGNLRYLKGNEVVHVLTADGKDHQYRVLLRKVVSPDDSTYIQPSRQETLTMYTCTGWLDSQRLILHAEPM